MHITLVVPTYNEAENLPRLVPALLALPLPELHILFVDDNSPDGTGQLAEQLAAQHKGRISVLHRPGRMGLGSAYVQSFQQALQTDTQAIGQMDADFSHPPEKIPEMVARLQDCDAVIGSRYVPGGSVDLKWPLWRKALSAWGNFYARTILGVPLRDMTGGFRLWRRESLEALPLERVVSNGYVFTVELAYLAYRRGLRFSEVPIYFADRRWGRSKMNWRIQLEAAWRVWQVKYAYRDLQPLAQI